MRTIKTKMTLVTIFMISLLALLISVMSADVQARYRELEVQACQAIVDLERSRLEAAATQLENNSAKLAALGMLYHQMHSYHSDLLSSILVEFFQSNPIAIGGGIWYEPWQLDMDRERASIYLHRIENVPLIDEAFEGEEYNYHSQQWYTELKEQLELGETQTAWSSLYTDEAGTFSLMLTVGSGIFDESGKFIGLSTLDWQIEDIAYHISSIRPTPGSFVLFADIHGDNILALSDNSMAENPLSQRIAGQSLSILPWFNKNQLDSNTYIIQGRKYLSFNSIQDDMLILVNVPEDELFENIIRYSSRVRLLLFAGCITISTLIWFLLNHFVNKPLNYLSRKAEEIGAGNLSPSIQLSTRDELGSLAKTLEQMTADIRKYISRLNTAAAELKVATEIQTSMLPSISPEFSNRREFDIYASMSAAREVGGDFYDFFLLDEHHLVVLIADVSEKGVPAALFMVVARTLIRNCTRNQGRNSDSFEFDNLGDVFFTINNLLCENNKAEMFVTAFMAVLDLRSGATAFVNAGHNQPCLRQADGQFHFIKTQPGFVLGGMENTQYTEGHLQLEPGDCLFLYTDGVTDAENTSGEFFGNQRLLEALNSKGENHASAILEEIETQLLSFTKDAQQYDDITMLSLVYQPGLHIEAEPECLSRVLEFIEQKMEGIPCSVKERMHLLVSVEEIFVNIANYAYSGKEGMVFIQVDTLENPPKIIIRFRDEGKPWNPLKHEDPDVNLSANERVPGGLGIYMAKNLVTNMEYMRIDGHNILTLTKILNNN